MGNSYSNYEPGCGMMIKFEKSNYYPGELVKGTVYIVMKKRLETRGLGISIIGTECTKFKTGEEEIPFSTDTDKNTLFAKHFTIHKWSNNFIDIGHYACPFHSTYLQIYLAPLNIMTMIAVLI
jgi:hypothetical protein